jgi:hypothetical protein
MKRGRAFLAASAVAVIAAVITLTITLGGRSSHRPPPGHPLSMLEEDVHLLSHPVRTLAILRSLGVGVVRFSVAWNSIAPDPLSRRTPSKFQAADPASYPPSSWTRYDAIVKAAAHDGIQLDFLLTGGAPLWATSPAPKGASQFSAAWKPSPGAYGQFVQAVATRYSGVYTPAGASSPLPRVHFWELWNEPNWGPSLEPQMALNPTRIVSAVRYRELADAAWSALSRSGHDHDTVVIGSLSPRGVNAPPESALAAAVDVSGPIGFTQTLYCVDSSEHPLRGAAALRAHCPTTAAGSQRFPRRHPALFQATGYGIHPYPINLPPTKTDTPNADTVEFSQIPRLEDTLDRVLEGYGSHRQLRIYNTEYGYITNPPNPGTQYLHPDTAAGYLNWAEYLTWRNARIATTMQYLLYDPPPIKNVFGKGGFATGLILYGGKPKATFYAYRIPIFLPASSASRGDPLEVWGCVRPARYAYLDTHRPQDVQIQFRPEQGGPFQTIKTVRLRSARSCYFDVDVRFPATGAVILRWSYPHGDPRLRDPVIPGQTIYSRAVPVRIH